MANSARRPPPVAGRSAGETRGELPGAGQRFGPYRTERVLGSGGMGAVYLARRVDGQFEQTVALKVMAPHLAGEEFVRSFRNERQLLAALAHPNIARLLDGGVAPGGGPYLVMEYIEGQLWNRYCADRKLPVEARIRLFLQVCEAVEFAHRNLIVHGDLKPANILVTRGRDRQAARFRHCQTGARSGGEGNPVRLADSALCESGATPRRAGQHAERCVFAGCDPLRIADRGLAVRRPKVNRGCGGSRPARTGS